MTTLFQNVIDALMKQAQEEDPFIAEVRAGVRSSSVVVEPPPTQENSEDTYYKLRDAFDQSVIANMNLRQYAAL
ncbi:hypothetical protein D769_15475 [Cupriavidus sp. HMR-1]|uniref:hypothetical protein n=1 Tax=Cupriavidus sp. HMR-1 TaxID=1249621 RepID=UPI0002A350F8|nr:hypothetical protein [Cupriavidus sp. HMR-1]EKZ98387.1 hypothetical protein D769_15475 [Cupriavidus sp. HMR-1]